MTSSDEKDTNDAPKRLWPGFASRAPSTPVPMSSVDADAERAAHLEHLRTVESLRMRAARTDPKPAGPSIREQAERKELRRLLAMRGKSGENFFPSLKCHICGGVPWLDPDTQRINEYHDPRGHDVDAMKTVRGQATALSSLTQLSLLAQHQRARASTGEHDDE